MPTALNPAAPAARPATAAPAAPVARPAPAPTPQPVVNNTVTAAPRTPQPAPQPAAGLTVAPWKPTAATAAPGPSAPGSFTPMKAGQEIPGTLPLQASIDAMKAQGFGSSFKPPPPTQPQPRLSVAARQARDNASGLTALRTKMGMQPTAGQAAAEAILGSGGDPKAYMAARGATPIGTMGSGQPKPRARPTAPAAVTPNKGRTTSMQRRGIGAGQAPGQPVPGKKAGPVTPAQAAQNFIAGRANKAQPAPVAAPPVAAQPRPIAAPVVR